MKKYLTIGDEVHFAAYHHKTHNSRSTPGPPMTIWLQDTKNLDMIKNGVACKGRIIAFYPSGKSVDVMTAKGHVYVVDLDQMGFDKWITTR